MVEAGANLPGEIARYREIIEPSMTIVTNAVAGHLEGFGSLAGVVAEKLSLTDGVPLAIVGVEPPSLAEGARKLARRVRTAALRDADLTPDRVELDDSARPVITFGGTSFILAARGLHQADNATRVWAVVEALGLDREPPARALEQFSIPSGRGELLQEGGLTILNDCYNANPQSFRASIATARRSGAVVDWCSSPEPCGSWAGLGVRSTGASRRRWSSSQPDLLARGRGLRSGTRALCRASWETG